MSFPAVARRLMQSAVTVLLVATLTFLAIHLAPGDPLQVVHDSPRATPRDLAELRQHYHLDDPVLVQYAHYLAQLVRGDWGTSFGQHRSVLAALGEALPATIELAIGAFCIMFGLGVTMGAWQGAHAGSSGDRVLSATSLVLWAVPAFWLALLLIIVFVDQLHWFPASGATDIVLYDTLGAGAKVADRLRHLVLPALALGIVQVGYPARYQRTALIEALRQPFVRAARARGLPRRAVLQHALRNALLPAAALFGTEMPALLSGAVVVEAVFGWPGMGRLAATAIFQRDYPLVTGAAILAAICVVVAGLVSDLMIQLADPRLRSAA